jgi:hypothetical protein
MPALEVSQEYIRGFLQANDTFLYQVRKHSRRIQMS